MKFGLVGITGAHGNVEHKQVQYSSIFGEGIELEEVIVSKKLKGRAMDWQ